MSRIRYFVLAAALLAAPAPLLAQTPGPTPDAQREHARGEGKGARKLGFLMQFRSELGLSDAQVTRLETIAQRLQEQNRPLVERLRAEGLPLRRGERGRWRDMTPEQRRELRAKMEQNRPTLQQLRENTRTAMEEARSVLTPEQRERARELMRERVREHREKRGHGPRAGQRGS